MKLEEKQLDIRQTGDFDEIEGNIQTKDMGLAISMVSKNLYSNPIGSFIREVVSNGVDANVDANIDSPVLVNIYKEDDVDYIEIKDNGVGMSPDTFRNIYMNWFNSDKRNTNDKIGGWGLGSKSPLAYQDSFEIITVFNGIEYTYILANELPKPKATLLFQEETDKENGTTIKIEIKEEDAYKVHTECISQLAYFNNVYVKDENYFYNNNFRIYESEHYKLRNSDFPYGRDMHICLGQVAYPIDFNVLKIDRVLLPVALKFEVGELEVTLSREEINYTEKVKQRILDKIELVSKEILEKYEEQLKITDFRDYLKLVNSRTKPDLIIEDVSINMTGFKSSISFTPLEDLKITKKYIDNLFCMYSLRSINNGKISEYPLSSSIRNDKIYKGYTSMYLVKNRVNFYDTSYINNGYLLKREKLEKKHINLFAELLDLIANKDEVTNNILLKDGAIGKIYKLIKYVDNFINTYENVKTYDGVCPEWWKEEYREKQKQQNEERKERITYYNVHSNRYRISISELLDYKLVFYADKKSKIRDLIAYETLYGKTNKYFRKNSKFIIINPTTIKKLKKYDNIHSIENIFKVKSFKRTLINLRLKYILDQNIIPFLDTFNYSRYYKTILLEVRKKLLNSNTGYSEYVESSRIEGDLYEHFKDEIDRIESVRVVDNVNKINVLLEYLNKLELLKYINHTTVPHRIIYEIIKKAKILKMNPEYYSINH